MEVRNKSGALGALRVSIDDGEMQPGKICPVCEKDIGIWPVFIAALPSRVTCPHCKSRLQYADTGVLVASLLALLLVCSAGAFFFVFRFVPYTRLEFALVWGSLIAAIWLPVELAVAVYMRAAKKLQPAGEATGRPPEGNRDS